MKTMKTTSAIAAALVACIATACTLPNTAAFGRACRSVDECADSTSTLRCYEGSCVSQAYIDAITQNPENPEDPEDPDPAEPTGETCADALPIAVGASISGSTVVASDNESAACTGEQRADRVYVVRLPTTTNLRITLETSTFDAALFASTDVACSSTTLIAGSCTDVNNNIVDGEEMRLFGVGPGEVFIVVDGADQPLLASSGTFTLSVREEVGCGVGFVAVAGTCVGVQQEVQMEVARTNHTATLLDDGRVLVVGGRTGAALEATSTAEIFDPATNTFALTGPLTTGRARHAAERLADGRVLVVGGVTGDDNDGYTPTATVEVYDPVSGTFSAAPSLPRRRDLTTATLVPNGGGVVVVGGRDGSTTLSDVITIDTALTAWTRRATLSEPRFGQLVTLVDDELLIIGGRAGTNGAALSTVEVFDTGANSIDPGVRLDQPRAAACGAKDGARFVIFGGYAGNSDDGFSATPTMATFNTSTETWADIFNDMSEARLFATATRVPGLGIIVAGGSLDDPLASVDLLGTDDVVTPLPRLTRARLAHAAVALGDRRVLVMGGDGGVGETVPLSSVEIIGPPLP
jgi:hypothetical protein